MGVSWGKRLLERFLFLCWKRDNDIYGLSERKNIANDNVQPRRRLDIRHTKGNSFGVPESSKGSRVQHSSFFNSYFLNLCAAW